MASRFQNLLLTEEQKTVTSWYETRFAEVLESRIRQSWHGIATEQQILMTESPKEHKRLGRAVSGFDDSVWNEARCEIVRSANIAKFSQNPELKKLLLETGDRAFVEASPFDKIWGIGLTANKPAAYDRTRWKGLNLLGDILNEVRNTLASSEL